MFLGETDFPLTRMHIHIDQLRIHAEIDDAYRIAMAWNIRRIGFDNGFLKIPRTNNAMIDENENAFIVGTMFLGIDPKTIDLEIIIRNLKFMG